MSKAISLKKGMNMLNEFIQKTFKYAPIGYGFVLSKWDSKIIKEYYRLKRGLIKLFSNNKMFKNRAKKLPSSVWLLRKYVFEILAIAFILIFLFMYYLYLPSFKGKASICYVSIILMYFYSRHLLIQLKYRIITLINELIKDIKDELTPAGEDS